MKKYWMIHNPTGGVPTKEHKTIEAARIEAVRLANIHAADKFVILEAIAVCHHPVPPVVIEPITDIPVVG